MAGNPDNVLAGPGWLYVAPFGTTEPTNATTALAAAYRDVGYTDEGNVFSYGITTEDVPVAEEFSPVKTYVTGVEGKLSFAMAEMTALNLVLALGGGVLTTAPASVEPPTPGTEAYVSIVHQTVSGARWLYRKCLQSATIEIANRKAPAKRLIPVEFKLVLPGGGAALFEAFPDADDLI